MPKAATTPTAASRRHNPLADDLNSVGAPRTKSTGKRKSRSDEEDRGDGYIDSVASRKILTLAQDLADEDAADRKAAAAKNIPNAAYGFDSRNAMDAAANSDEEADDGQFHDEDDEWMPGEDVEVEDVDPEDMAAYSKFLPRDDSDPIFDPTPSKGDSDANGGGTNLADLILQRIAEKEAAQSAQAAGQPVPIFGGGDPADAVEIPAKVVDVFQKCGLILSRYKSGPLPKPFKVLPTLPQWPDLLAITRPEQWTPNACYAATKIFVSSQPIVVQHYLTDVLLDRIREDIHETGKLNVHLFNALKKSLYKPAAFFKGFLFPLVDSGTATLREASIVSGVLSRVSIPVLHSAAALVRLCEIAAEQSSVNTESAGATNIFIRTLLAKKYALPYKAVDALVFHFLRFRNSVNPDLLDTDPSNNNNSTKFSAQRKSKDQKLPVLWHQCLLEFAQRYKNDITEDQREALLDLLLIRGHEKIGPEVRRELLAGRGRGVVEMEMKMKMEMGVLDSGVAGKGNLPGIGIGIDSAGGAVVDDGDDTMMIS
ncbi:putative rrna processing protein bystin [Phaeomoniella chlamydospora]|uniref:Putative rrna processing protein bystin n=1 Tax=Phaeomoniella chlamydospora TaxID=158046 RepID=A0A0G2G7X9_PHACM|nr:putative rrna processing protein bystin [Phaeomoniella chlamydospora]